MIVCLRVVPHQAAGEALGSHLRRAIREAAKHHDTEQPADKSTGDVEEQWDANILPRLQWSAIGFDSRNLQHHVKRIRPKRDERLWFGLIT